jgi:hypothetical protein
LVTVVVGAAFEPEHFVALGSQRRQHEDRHVAVDALVADRPAERHTVDAGQHQVEDDDVERFLEGELEARPAVAHRQAAVAGAVELVRDQLADAPLVLNEEHAGRRNRDRLGGHVQRAGFFTKTPPRAYPTSFLNNSDSYILVT